MIIKRFGEKVNQRRKEMNITAQQLADMCHVNCGYMRQILSGKLPSGQIIIKLCEVLDLSPNYLFEMAENSRDKVLIEKINKLTPNQKDTLIYLLDAYNEFNEKNSALK